MRKIMALSLVLASLFLMGGCSLYGGSSNDSTPNNSAPASAAGSEAGAATVAIQDFAFSPATLAVKKGVTVTWTNNDLAPHQIKLVAFNSARLDNSQSFSFIFNDVGTFDYSCAIHPSMTGQIIVE